MIAAISFHEKDTNQAIELLSWIKLLGGCPNHSCLLVADAGVSWAKAEQVLNLAREAFKSASIITNERPIEGWIEGSQSLFLTAAQYIEEHRKQPWLWLEPDAIPLKRGWLDTLESVYQQANKPFMGFIYDFANPNPPIAPFKVMSGIAVYPADAWSRMVKPIRFNPTLAFDVSCAPVMVESGIHTNLIQNFFGEIGFPPTFVPTQAGSTRPNAFGLDKIHPSAVLFHRCKDGSLYQLLTPRLLPQLTQSHVFVVLGRYGDLILHLPGWKAIHDYYGIKPIVVVSHQFVDLFEGVSYVIPHPLKVDPYRDVKNAVATAISRFGDCVVPKIWDDPRKKPAPVQWVPCSKPNPDGPDWDSYMTAQWEHSGFTRSQLLDWPVVFDRRDVSREKALIRKLCKTDKPKLLFNFGGITSQLSHHEKGLLQQVIQRLSRKYEPIDLGPVKATRIYDLLGLYDIAEAMITSDTATLHLASASKLKYVPLIANGGSGSVPRGNCVLKMRYADISAQYQKIEEALQ